MKKGVDKFAVERLARVLLNEFSAGVAAGYQWSTDDPEEQRRIRNDRRKKLGSDLFSVGRWGGIAASTRTTPRPKPNHPFSFFPLSSHACSDVPFTFPPTFTFVFRAFTSLDGIGKGLDAQYDITRIAQPYLKELVDLRDGCVHQPAHKAPVALGCGERVRWTESSHFYPFLAPVCCECSVAIRSAILSVLKSWGKALGWRPIDIANAVQSPRKVRAVQYRRTGRRGRRSERSEGAAWVDTLISLPLSLSTRSVPSLLFTGGVLGGHGVAHGAGIPRALHPTPPLSYP